MCVSVSVCVCVCLCLSLSLDDRSRQVPKSRGQQDKIAGGMVGKEKIPHETKNIVELTSEFTEIIAQMAFEKFDFHQWLR